MDWKPEVFKLAEKLGTTAAYLWSVLYKQALIEGIESIAAGLFAAILIIIAYKYGNDCFKKAEEDEDEEYYVRAYLLRMLGLIFAGVSLTFFVAGIEHFLNPGYFALHEVLDALSK